MKAEALGRSAVKYIHSIVNFMVLVVIMLLVAFAGFALWDSDQLYRSADRSNYSIYKPPGEDNSKSFQELQAMNPDVFAWLTVYGTNVDYPVLQGINNMKYLSTNPEGNYSISGSIFLDSENSKDFSDFNSILYGHHMEKRVMFGEIGSFSRKDVFDTHKYGNLFYDGKDHGIEFFKFVHCDGYDSEVFTVNIQEARRQAYLEYLAEKEVNSRDIGVTEEDRIILLSTCSSRTTNGRDILVGRITDEVFEDPFYTEPETNVRQQLFVDSPVRVLDYLINRLPLVIAILVVLIILLILIITYKRKRKKRGNRNG